MSKVLDAKSIIRLSLKHTKDPFNKRDGVVLALVGLAYFNANELSLVRVKDLISERNGLITEGYLPSVLSANGIERYYYFGKDNYLSECLENYLKWRNENNLGCLDRGLYCGLDPESYFILKNNGDNFGINYKNRFDGDTQTQPLQMQRLIKSYFLGEGVSITSLMDSFIANYWNVKSKQGSTQAIKDLMSMTGLTAETLRKKCIRKQDSIQDILMGLYK